MQKNVKLPEKSGNINSLLHNIEELHQKDQGWEHGKMFGFVFHHGEETTKFLEKVFIDFAHMNRLNPTSFSSLRKFETEVVSMCAGMMHGSGNVVGTVTSGGTESLIMSVLVAREMAKEKNIRGFEPELVLPVTAHPALLKACHYLNVRPVLIPVGDDKRVIPQKIDDAINEHTIMVVCSAPCYPFGVMDPVEEISKIAEKRKILLHVDACMGGFMLPFMKENGYPVPSFDFSLPGVTSISLDVHKYGYAMKGASVILYRNPEMRMKQFFVYADWPGGIFASVAMLGTRSGGPVASAWAAMNYLGKEGYCQIVREVMEAVHKLTDAIRAIPGLQIISNPEMSLLALTSDSYNIFYIADLLEEKGWHLDRQQFPDSIHMTISWGNVRVMDSFISDLNDVMHQTRRLKNESQFSQIANKIASKASAIIPGKTIGKIAALLSLKEKKGSSQKHKSGQAAMYGLTGSLKDRGKVTDTVAQLMDGLYRI